MKLVNRLSIGQGKSNSHQAFWALIGSLSSFSLAVISSAILSRYFSKEEYGTYRQIVYIYSTLLVVFTAGLPQVFAYFLPRFAINEGKAIVWKITRFLILGGAVFSVFLFFASGIIANFLNNPELERGIKAFSPIPLLLLPTLGIEGIFSAYKKTIFIGIYDSITRILMLGFIVLPVVLWKGSYIAAIYGWNVVSLLTLLIAFFFKDIPFRGIESIRTSLSYRTVFSYSLPLVGASLWGMAIKAADQFYISRFFGASVFAEFSNGFIQLPFVSMITGAVSLVLMPVFSRMIHDKSDAKEIVSVWRSALYKSAIIIYPIVIFFIFFANDIILILFSNTYSTSTIYFRINMLLNFFNIIVFAPLLLALGKTRIYARIHMIYALVVWILEYLVIYLFNSPIGVAIVSVSLSIAAIIAFIVYISKLMDIGLIELVPFREIFKIVIHGLLIILVVKFAIDSMRITSTLIECALALIVYASILLLTSRLFNLDYISNIKPLLRLNKKE